MGFNLSMRRKISVHLINIFSVFIFMVLITNADDIQDNLKLSDDETVMNVDSETEKQLHSTNKFQDKVNDINEKDDITISDSGRLHLNQETVYRDLFEKSRALQLQAIKTLQSYGKFEQRYNLVSLMLDQMFQVLSAGKINLTEWGTMPDDVFPTNQTIREALSAVFENTALFGELVLRMPDIVHPLYDKKREWHLVLAWSVWFCTESRVFEGANAKLLDLMSQEVGLKEKSADFINPFTEDHKQKKHRGNEPVNSEPNLKPSKKKRKEKRKGPRMSGAPRTEL